MTKEIAKSKRFKSYDKQKKIWAIIFLTPWILGFVFIYLVPMVTSFVYSFFHLESTVDGLVLTWVGFQNYYNSLQVEAIGDTIFKAEMLTTIQEVLINIPVIIIFSLFISVILNAEFKGRAIARAIFFIPVILNSAAVVSALSRGEAMSEILAGDGVISQVFDLENYLMRAGLTLGMIGFITGLISRIYSILALAGVPILLFLASIQSIPRHLYEAAEIEGATQYEMFWLITLPNVKPHLMTVSIFILIDTFVSSPLSKYIDRLKQTQWGLRAAMSWLYVVVVILLLVVLVIVSKLFKWGETHYD